MRGGTLTAGAIVNNRVITGIGTISGSGIDNSGSLFASNGMLTASFLGNTNRLGGTIGTVTTNATSPSAINQWRERA